MPKMVDVICANRTCKAPFQAREADRKRGWGKFCSKSCKATVQERRTGQMARYLERCDGYMKDAAMSAMEEGWDGHKVWTS